MKKSDLAYGNVVETREGVKYIHLQEDVFYNLLNIYSSIYISYYDNYLNYKDGQELSSKDIMKVYKDYTCKELLWERKEKKLVISEDEKAILRNLPKDYKWIARDLSGMVYIYAQRPTKESCMWSGDFGGLMLPFDHLFKFIQWRDEEPYLIEDLLKGE